MTPEELFEKHQAFAVWIANKYRGLADIDDLKQQAFIGLFNAAQKFDEAHGTAFASFARPFIWREVLRFLEKSNTIHIPRHIIEHARAIKRVEFENMSVEQIVAATELSEKEVKQALHYMSTKTSSIDESAYLDDATTLGELIAAEEENWDDNIVFNDFIKTLNEQEVKIVQMRLDGMSQERIGETLNIHQMSISRALRRIKGKLEKYIA